MAAAGFCCCCCPPVPLLLLVSTCCCVPSVRSIADTADVMACIPALLPPPLLLPLVLLLGRVGPGGRSTAAPDAATRLPSDDAATASRLPW